MSKIPSCEIWMPYDITFSLIWQIVCIPESWLHTKFGPVEFSTALDSILSYKMTFSKLTSLHFRSLRWRSPSFQLIDNVDCISSVNLVQIFAVVDCYTARLVSCLPTFRDSVLAPSSRGKQSTACLLDGWRWGPIRCSETSVSNWQVELRNIPEERRPCLHRDGSHKFRTTFKKNTLLIVTRTM